MVGVIIETFVVAEPAAVAAALHVPDLWRRMFAGLELTVSEGREEQGIRFTVTGPMAGSGGFWVEPRRDGAVVRYFLSADLTKRGSATQPITGPSRRLARRGVRAGARHSALVRAHLNALKDTLEAGRPPGTARGTAPMARGAHPPSW